MGIRSSFDGDFKAINLASMADDMLAQVVADHARDQFTKSNRANALVAGGFVPYTAEVNGRTVHRGRGEILPRQQLELAIKPPGRTLAHARTRMPVIHFNWQWERLDASAMQKALERLGKIYGAFDNAKDAVQFLQALATRDSSGLFRLLLEKVAERRYPGVFARFDQAKALFKIYRLVRFAAERIGADESDADPDVLAWIASELRARSPVLSGGYRDAHALYADGAFLMDAADVREDSTLPKADEFSFTNTVPYARKIEFGKTKAGRDFVIQVPNRIYERTAKDAAQRFRGVAEIAFEMRAVIGAAQTPQRSARRAHNKPGVRYPAIVVRF